MASANEQQPVSEWLSALKRGEELAAQQLWDSYVGRLLALARRKLQQLPRGAYDEEDVVISAFNSFIAGVQAGRIASVKDRHNLWTLLVVITARKVVARTRYLHRDKRIPDPLQFDGEVAGVIGNEPSPEFAAEVADEYGRLLALLDEEPLRKIAIMKMEGFTNEEIGSALNCAKRTVQRKLERIRRIFEEEADG